MEERVHAAINLDPFDARFVDEVAEHVVTEKHRATVCIHRDNTMVTFSKPQKTEV